MILFVNGDSHTAAAEAVTPHAFAMDDPNLFYMGRAPHPANIAVSWGKLLAQALRAGFHCGAESASSNDRIMRTTRDWLHKINTGYNDILVIIQWSTWERQEWLIDGTYYQINASGTDDVPVSHRYAYKQYVADVDWQTCTQQAHDKIWQFHQELTAQGIKHIFFNGNNHFAQISDRRDWGHHYIGPYDAQSTFDATIRSQGIQTVAPDSWHFGSEGHSIFYRFMLQYIVTNKII